MSRMNVAIVGLCCCGVGLLGALFVQSLSRGSFDDLRDERDGAVKRAQELEDNVRTLQSEIHLRITSGQPPAHKDGTGGWGILDGIRKNLGPGSRFQRMATALHDAGVWDPDAVYWMVSKPNRYDAEAHLNLTTIGPGKVAMVAVIDMGDFDQTCLMFNGDWFTDRDAAFEGFDGRVDALAQGAGLDDTERRRLRRFLFAMPMPTNRRFREVIPLFLRSMPRRAQDEFAATMVVYADAPEHQRLGTVPAVGAALSERYAAELIFGKYCSTSRDLVDVPYREMSKWWSLLIYPAKHLAMTSADPDRLDFKWPRLTAAEVDALENPSDDARQ